MVDSVVVMFGDGGIFNGGIMSGDIKLGGVLIGGKMIRHNGVLKPRMVVVYELSRDVMTVIGQMEMLERHVDCRDCSSERVTDESLRYVHTCLKGLKPVIDRAMSSICDILGDDSRGYYELDG